MSYTNFPSPTPVFPFLPVQGFPVHKRPVFTSWQHRSVTGKQYQTFRQVYPNWQFELQYAQDSWLREQTQNIVLFSPNSPYVEFETISQLFLSCQGKFGEFYYDDLEDDSRLGEDIGVGDSSTQHFRISRTWGSGALARIEPVGGINLGGITNVYLNGGAAISPSLYTVTNDLDGSHLNFITPPGSGVVITMDFSFYYRCRWMDDVEQYDQWARNLWNFGKCSFQSVKP